MNHRLQVLDSYSLLLIQKLQQRSLNYQTFLATDDKLRKVSDAIFTITDIQTMPIDCNIYFPIQLWGNIYITQAKKLWTIEFLSSTTSQSLSSQCSSSIQYERCNSDFHARFRHNLFIYWWRKAIIDGCISSDSTLDNWAEYLGGDLHNWTSLDFAYTAKWIFMGENPIIPPWYVREFFEKVNEFSQDGLYPCILCDKRISNLTDLEDHYLCHSKLCLKCKICGKTFVSTSQSIEHFQNGLCLAINCTDNKTTLMLVEKIREIREKCEQSRRPYETAFRAIRPAVSGANFGQLQHPCHVNIPNNFLEIKNNSNIPYNNNDNSCAPSFFSIPSSNPLHSSNGMCYNTGNSSSSASSPSINYLHSHHSHSNPHHHHPISPPSIPLPPPPSPSQPQVPIWRLDPMAYLNSSSPYLVQSNDLYHIPSHSRAVIASPENYQNHSSGISNRLPQATDIGNFINNGNLSSSNHNNCGGQRSVIHPQCMMKIPDTKLLIEEDTSSSENRESKCRSRKEENGKSKSKKKMKIYPPSPQTYQMSPLNYSVKCDGVQYDIDKP